MYEGRQEKLREFTIWASQHIIGDENHHPLKDAHAALDEAVLAAYNFSPKKDLLAQLLDLNHAVAAKEKAGEAVTAPGVPATYGDATSLVTEDCVRP